jgi:hypothetical protein
MSFIPPTIPTVVNEATSGARVDEVNTKAERYARLHGGDGWEPEPGRIHRTLSSVRAKLVSRHAQR